MRLLTNDHFIQILGLVEALKRLEPYVVKVASTVLRRGSDSQYHSLIRQDDEQNRKPLMYAALSDRFIAFCTCKETSLPPICDGSHRKLEGSDTITEGTLKLTKKVDE